jgi:hypothetical protein
MSQQSSFERHSASLPQTHENPLETLLVKPAQNTSAPTQQAALSGVALGRILGIAQDGRISLSVPVIGGEPLWASSLCRISPEQIGQICAVQFIDGDATQPLVIGILLTQADSVAERRATSVTVIEDDQSPKQLVLEAQERLVLRCGKAFITMTSDGNITMQGVYLYSRAQATHRIRAASLQAN